MEKDYEARLKAEPDVGLLYANLKEDGETRKHT
jgi:hypothetical protein